MASLSRGKKSNTSKIHVLITLLLLRYFAKLAAENSIKMYRREVFCQSTNNQTIFCELSECVSLLRVI